MNGILFLGLGDYNMFWKTSISHNVSTGSGDISGPDSQVGRFHSFRLYGYGVIGYEWSFTLGNVILLDFVVKLVALSESYVGDLYILCLFLCIWFTRVHIQMVVVRYCGQMWLLITWYFSSKIMASFGVFILIKSREFSGRNYESHGLIIL